MIKYRIPIVFTIMLFLGYNLNAQNKFEISTYGGGNAPLGNFDNFAQSGYDYGISTDYFFGNRFGLGFDFNQQVNSPDVPFNFARIPNDPINYSINSSLSGEWVSRTFGIGPVYRIGNKKFKTDIYSKGGLSMIKSPSYQTSFLFSGIDKSLLTLGAQEINSLGVTSGLRFNYQLNNNLAFFVNPQYVYSSAKVDYTYTNINNAFFIDQSGVLSFDPGLLVEQPNIEEQLDLSYGSINAGITFTLGGNKSKRKRKIENPNVANPSFPSCNLTFVSDTCEAGIYPFVFFNASWLNMLPTDILTISSSLGAAISGGTNTPLTQISGNRNFNLIYNPSQSGLIDVVKIDIHDAAGNLKCNKTLSILLPPCKPKPENCDLTYDLRPCEYNDSNIELDLTANWNNQIPVGSILTVDLFDRSNSPITPSPVLIPGVPYSTTAGSTSHTFFNIDVGDYEGTTIKAVMEICWVDPNGVPNCCQDEVFIDVPTCCYDCDGVSIQNLPNQNVHGDGFFKWYWQLLPVTGASIEQMTFTLQSFGADDYTATTVLPRPNFEITGIIPTTTINMTIKPIGSLANRRSNYWVAEFSPAITSGNFYTIIEVFDRKMLRNQLIKVVIYTTDGKRCTQYLQFNN